MVKKGWFKTQEQDGDRTLEQQLEGLDDLLAAVPGKTVLDVGCAEGLIDVKLAETGAKSVHGIDIVGKHIEYARRHAVPSVTKFDVGDAMLYPGNPGSVDIVLLLAVLHKLKDPVGVARKFGGAAREMVVLRMPPAGAVLTDPRSGGKPHDIGAVLAEQGWVLRNESRGSFNEWIGYYVKPSASVVVEPPTAVVETASPEAETKPAEAETESPFEKTVPLRGDTSDALPSVPPESEIQGTDAPYAGDTAERQPVERIETPPMEGSTRRRRPATRKADE